MRKVHSSLLPRDGSASVAQLAFALLAVTLGVTVLAAVTAVRSVGAAPMPMGAPSISQTIKMYHQTFAQQDLPTDGNTPVVLAQQPFSARTGGEVEVTAAFDLFAGTPNGGIGGSSQPLASLNCKLTLDSSTLITFQRSWHALPVDRSVDLTATATIFGWSHTLSLTCTGWLDPSLRSADVIQVTGEGLSVIVAA